MCSHKKPCKCGKVLEFFSDNGKVQCSHCERTYAINWKPIWIEQHAPYLIEV